MRSYAKPDLLLPLTIRLPKSLLNRIREEADELGRTVSDHARSMFTPDEAVPLGMRPRRPNVAVSSKFDPELMRELSMIGRNLTQIARGMSTASPRGEPHDAVKILAAIVEVERRLSALGAQYEH